MLLNVNCPACYVIGEDGHCAQVDRAAYERKPVISSDEEMRHFFDLLCPVHRDAILKRDKARGFVDESH